MKNESNSKVEGLSETKSAMKTANEILIEHLGGLLDPIPNGTLYGITNAMEDFAAQFKSPSVVELERVCHERGIVIDKHCEYIRELEAEIKELKSPSVVEQNLSERSQKIELLEAYSEFLQKEGYIDTDWGFEPPFAIDQFLATRKSQPL